MNGKVAFVGNSFIRRLRDDINRKSHPTFQHKFGIEGIDIRYACKGGWCAEHISANIPKIVAQAPQMIILQCDTNDLCKTDGHLSVGFKLLDTAIKVKELTGAEWVFLLSNPA